MIKKAHLLKTTIAVATAPVLLLGVAACGSTGNSAKETVTQTVGSSASNSAASTAGHNSTAQNNGQAASNEPGAAANQAPEILLNGTPVEGDFAPVQCANTTDDGRQQMKYQAGKDHSGSSLKVEINNEQPQMLESIELKAGSAEWETSDADERAATVEKNGDKYSVTSKVHKDNAQNETAEVKVTFSCAGA